MGSLRKPKKRKGRSTRSKMTIPGPNEYALIQEGNSSFHMNVVSPTLKMISHRIFNTLPADADENNTDSYVDRLHNNNNINNNNNNITI